MPETQLISNIIKVENEHSRMVEQYENESVYSKILNNIL